MSAFEPSFTIGIEEEYLLVDLETLDLVEAPDALMADCKAELEGQVSPEFLQCQIEIGTKVCANISEAHDDLRRLRTCVRDVAQKYGMAPIAASCHPSADYQRQHHTDNPRYHDLSRDLAGVARRMLICGQHVHVGIENDEARIDLLSQFPYFLPHLLALSGSSPYWKGEDTGLASYRLTVFDNLPRTGLPPVFSSWSEYERSIQMIIDSGAIKDTTKIWWDLRPSARFQTLENRICDVSPRMEDALTMAAITQCLMRMLWRLRKNNQRWRVYDRFLVGENRWRAQRYGVTEGLIDFGAAEVKSISDLVDEMLDLVGEDAEALGCLTELSRAKDIARDGSSAQRQRQVYQRARDAGEDDQAALRAVVDSLIGEFSEGL
ncbi:MAG: carboxylate-amine ligase [Paracoccaceae bacterium]|nr:carboxylate-amine ligase [Paracoccaceae bacterium]MDG1736763.1 carboxylate-amine ligase [Paracoccaceae bacterium]MDG2258312.1 carboxylate-amine ligase [Paracoccaceae bacterium]